MAVCARQGIQLARRICTTLEGSYLDLVLTCCSWYHSPAARMVQFALLKAAWASSDALVNETLSYDDRDPHASSVERNSLGQSRAVVHRYGPRQVDQNCLTLWVSRGSCL